MFAHVLKMVLIDLHCKDNKLICKFQMVNIHSQNNKNNPLTEKDKI
nr:MAG TPA: hypothetical protein [Caudoviricetes sp.]DAY07506.1 MAG TPA: hypothetical protein [Caudoviricetes sp.]